MRKQRVIIYLVCISLLASLQTLLSTQPSFAYQPCPVNAQGELEAHAGNSTNQKWCLITPQSMKINIDYLGLCSSAPTIQNYRQTCEALIPYGSNKEVTTDLSSVQNLASAVTLFEGNYTHAVVLIKNVISHSSKVKFAGTTPRKGIQRAGAQQTEGMYCWSLDGDAENTTEDDQTTYLAECGDAFPTTIGANVSTKHSLVDPVAGPGTRYSGTTSSTSYTVYVLKSDGTENSGWNAAQPTEASHMLGIQTFNTPVKISGNSSNINLGFRLENTFGISFDDDEDDYQVRRFTLGGFEFSVTTD